MTVSVGGHFTAAHRLTQSAINIEGVGLYGSAIDAIGHQGTGHVEAGVLGVNSREQGDQFRTAVHIGCYAARYRLFVVGKIFIHQGDAISDAKDRFQFSDSQVRRIVVRRIAFNGILTVNVSINAVDHPL